MCLCVYVYVCVCVWEGGGVCAGSMLPSDMVDICKDHVSARAEEEVVVYLG